MTTIGANLGLTTCFFVVAAVLCCGNTILMATDAFQTRTTEFVRPLSPPRQQTVQKHLSFGGERTNHWQSRRLFATMAPAASPPNATSTNDSSVESEEETLIPSEVFFPSPDFEEEKPVSSTKDNKRGRKRRAIQKMRQNRFSRPIESRIARTLLFPMRVVIWKPFWMLMDIFIDRLGDDKDEGGVNLLDRVDTKESIGVSTTPQTAQDASSTAAVESEESSVSESTSLQSTASIAETVAETVVEDQSTASIAETVEETVEEDDLVPAIEDDDAAADDIPRGDRWAVAAPGVDLSGRWELIVTDDFKEKYDKYLEGLGQPKIVRTVALSGPVIGQTMEELIQIDGGQSLLIRGKNIRGTWDRTLVASGSTKNSPDFEPFIATIPTVDQELVQAEAWWEDQGKAHVSWMRGVTMYGGGSFYSRRYFEEKEHEDDETVYVCEGFFEFNDPNKERNELTWRFRRMKK